MSLRRINTLIMSNILPFNFGMNYEEWVKLYDNPNLQDLCPSDPRTWSQETIESVNKRAQEENELFDRLMALPDTEFFTEVERLEKLNCTKE